MNSDLWFVLTIVVLGVCAGVLAAHYGVAYRLDLESATLQKYDGISQVACTSDSMGLTIDCNDRLYMQKFGKEQSVEIGSIYTFWNEENTSVVHRAIGCVDDNCTQVIFKGDNNRVADPIVNRSQIDYKVVMVEYR